MIWCTFSLEEILIFGELTLLDVALILMNSLRKLSSSSSRRQFHKEEKLAPLNLDFMVDSNAAIIYFNLDREIRKMGVFSLYED